MSRIQLSASASITPTADGIVLRSDLGTFELKGADIGVFITTMAPLLDGSRDIDGVVAALADYSRASVAAFLGLLERYGLLETIPDDQPGTAAQLRGQWEFFRKWTEQPDELLHRLSRARILLVGLEPWGVSAAAELAAAGVGSIHILDDRVVTHDDLLSVRLWNEAHVGRPRAEALAESIGRAAPWCQISSDPLVLAEGYLLPREDAGWDLAIGASAGDDLRVLQALARFCHRAGLMSLTGHLDGLDAIVGPVVVPGVTACWNCCRLRELGHADHPETTHELHSRLLGERPGPRLRTYLAPMAPLLGHLLALEALKLLTSYTASQLVGRLLVQNLVSFETAVHTIIRMPWCEVCGGAAGGDPQGGPGKELPAANRSSDSAGLYDAADPAEVRAALAGWVGSRTGVIRQLSIATPSADEPELPITASALLAAYTEGTYHPLAPELASGKGLTAAEAMIGAAGEAIERYSASRYRQSDLHRSAGDRLDAPFLDPRRLSLYDDDQYRHPHFPYSRVEPDQTIDWTLGRWLDTGESVWLPALPTYFNYFAPHHERFCQVTSNGLAAGSGVADATQRAVCELVERDAFMLTWHCQLPARRVAIDGAIDLGAREVARQLEEAGAQIELYLLDVGTSIPTIACFGFGDGQRWPGVTVSIATHLSPRRAARKAILEHGHVGPYIRRLMRATSPIPAGPNAVRTLTDHALYYAPAERASVCDFFRQDVRAATPLGDLPEPHEVSLEAYVARLRVAGLRVAVKDVTSPDVLASPFRVVRALGPDLQPIDFGFELRRLGNPRLQAMLSGPVNPHPHPVA